MEVVASGPIGTKAFAAVVVADLSLVFVGDVSFGPDFLITVRKGTLS